MSANAAAPADNQRWRDKYLDLLEQQERNQVEYDNHLDQLRRGLVRVSLAADGQDEPLDKHLKSLREHLRGAGANLVGVALDRHLDNIDQALSRFDSRKASLAEQALESLLEVEAKLQAADLPKAIKKELKQFRRSLKGRLQVLTEYPTLWLDFLQIQRQLLEAAADSPEPGFFQRLFAKAEPPPSQHTNQDTGHSEQAYGDNQSGDNQADQPRNGESVITISQEIGLSVRRMLERLPINDDKKPQAAALVNRLSQGVNWYELVPSLEETVEIVISTLCDGQQAMESFLLGLNERLADVRGFLEFNQHDRQQSRIEQHSIDSQMRAGMDSIQQSASDANNLEELKSVVQGQVESLLQMMDKYKDDKSQREQALEVQLQQLTERLEQIEAEADGFRRDLEVQRQRALRDNLTKLPNRSAYERRLAEEYQRFKRYGNPLTLVVGDVDFFKRINDNYGHQAGDRVLQLIARELGKALRDADFVGRYGGEEFVILMPETNLQEAQKAVEKVRKSIQQCPFHFSGESLQITMSFGVAAFTESLEPEDVFALADQALYQAKANGRNRIEFSD